MKPERADYMAGKVSHHEYYGAVARTAGLSFLACHERVVRWRGMLRNGDEHLNGLRLPYWDSLAAQARDSIARALKQHGDGWSMAGGVCVVKAAARDAVLVSDWTEALGLVEAS